MISELLTQSQIEERVFTILSDMIGRGSYNNDSRLRDLGLEGDVVYDELASRIHLAFDIHATREAILPSITIGDERPDFTELKAQYVHIDFEGLDYTYTRQDLEKRETVGALVNYVKLQQQLEKDRGDVEDDWVKR